jgi:hypothetical protein
MLIIGADGSRMRMGGWGMEERRKREEKREARENFRGVWESVKGRERYGEAREEWRREKREWKKARKSEMSVKGWRRGRLVLREMLWSVKKGWT